MKHKPLTPEEFENLTEEDNFEEYNKNLLSVLKSINMAINNLTVMIKKLDENYNSLLSRLTALQEQSNDFTTNEKWAFEVQRDYRDLITNIIAERKDGYQA